MDKKLVHVNRQLYWWGDYVRAGMTCEGVFRTSQWPGKPEEDKQKTTVKRTKKPKSLVNPTQPAESRTTRPTVPCLRYDRRSEDIHKIIVRLPEDYKPLILCIWIRGMSYRDISASLGVTSRKIWEVRKKVLQTIKNKL